MTNFRALCIAVALAASAPTVAHEGEEGPKAAAATADVRTLQRVALDAAFTPGRDVLMDVVVIPPNTALDKHWHPGEEFHYYLEGEVTIEIDGQAPIIGRPGGHGHVPFRKHHRAVAGPAGAKILVVRVHTTGEPWRHLVEDAQPPRDEGSVDAQFLRSEGSRYPAVHRLLAEIDRLLPTNTEIERFEVEGGAVRMHGRARGPGALVEALNGSRMIGGARLGDAKSPGAESNMESFVVEAQASSDAQGAGKASFVPGADFDEGALYLRQRVAAIVAKHARDESACQIIMSHNWRSLDRAAFERVTVKVRMRCAAKELRAILADLETSEPALLMDHVSIRKMRVLPLTKEVRDVAFDLFGYLNPADK